MISLANFIPNELTKVIELPNQGLCIIQTKGALKVESFAAQTLSNRGSIENAKPIVLPWHTAKRGFVIARKAQMNLSNKFLVNSAKFPSWEVSFRIKKFDRSLPEQKFLPSPTSRIEVTWSSFSALRSIQVRRTYMPRVNELERRGLLRVTVRR